MAVPEEDRPLRLTAQHSLLARLRVGREGLHVGYGRAVHDQDAVQLRPLRELVEAGGELEAE